MQGKQSEEQWDMAEMKVTARLYWVLQSVGTVSYLNKIGHFQRIFRKEAEAMLFVSKKEDAWVEFGKSSVGRYPSYLGKKCSDLAVKVMRGSRHASILDIPLIEF